MEFVFFFAGVAFGLTCIIVLEEVELQRRIGNGQWEMYWIFSWRDCGNNIIIWDMQDW